MHDQPDFLAGLSSQASSSHLEGRRIAVVAETLGEGVSQPVQSALDDAISHFRSLGATVEEVRQPAQGISLHASQVDH